MKKILYLGLLGLLISCSIYKVPIVQGNYLRKDLIEQIKVGQTKAAVREILGDSVLPAIMKTDEWVYLYTEQFGSNLNQVRNYRMVIQFKQGKVSNIYVKS